MNSKSKSNYKAKHPYANNRLVELRERYSLTQEEVAAELGVSTKAYQSYESGVRRIPQNKIGIITSKYGYSENYIYNEAEMSRFTLDIRDLISYDGNEIQFTIPISYWDYLLKKQQVYANYPNEKIRNNIIARMEKTYANNSNYSYSVKIDWNNFMSFFNPDEGVKIPHLSSKDLTFPNEIPAEKVNEATQFLQELIQSSEEN